MTSRIARALALMLGLLLVFVGAVGAAPSAPKPTPTPTPTPAPPWSTLGNAGTNPQSNFLGTTDGNDLVFRTNGAEQARILTNGNVGIGTISPGSRLSVVGGVDTTTGYSIGGATVLRIPGTQNTLVGAGAGQTNDTGGGNTASGYQALFSNTSGSSNTASGVRALASNATGDLNTATGVNALFHNTGSGNTASGASALSQSTAGANNTAGGVRALYYNKTGNNNTALGDNAGGAVPEAANVDGSYNTFIGSGSGPASGQTSLANATAVGANATVGASNALVLGSSGVSVGIGTTTPQSTLQVVGGYVQLPTITGGPPPGADCDSVDEAGRMVVRTDGSTNLYVCLGAAGWVGK